MSFLSGMRVMNKRTFSTQQPMAKMKETFKVIVIDYSATGEGRHVFIKTGTEESIKEDIGDWLYQGGDVYTVEQWLELDRAPHSSSCYQDSNLEVLKEFAPALWEAMNQGLPMLVDVEYHWNQS